MACRHAIVSLLAPVSKADAGGSVVVEQLSVADVAPNDRDRAVARLILDRALALAGLGGRGSWGPLVFSAIYDGTNRAKKQCLCS